MNKRTQAFLQDARRYVLLGELLMLNGENTITQWKGMWHTSTEAEQDLLHERLKADLLNRENHMIRLGRQARKKAWPRETAESVQESILGYLQAETEEAYRIAKLPPPDFQLGLGTKIADLKLPLIMKDDFFMWAESEFGINFPEEYEAETVGELVDKILRLMTSAGLLEQLEQQPGRLHRLGNAPSPEISIVTTSMSSLQIMNKILTTLAAKFELYASRRLEKVGKVGYMQGDKLTIEANTWKKAAKELRGVADTDLTDESHSIKPKKGQERAKPKSH